MKVAVILIGFLFMLTGCASVSYLPYCEEEYMSKPEDTRIFFLRENDNRPHKTIGRLTVSGGTGILTQMAMRDIQQRFLAEARLRGADAFKNLISDSRELIVYMTTPGGTEYETVYTNHNGSFSGNVNSNYGYNSANYSGNYSGTSTTQVPVTTPPVVTPHTVIANSMSGDLVIFTDKLQDSSKEEREALQKRLTESTAETE